MEQHMSFERNHKALFVSRLDPMLVPQAQFISACDLGFVFVYGVIHLLMSRRVPGGPWRTCVVVHSYEVYSELVSRFLKAAKHPEHLEAQPAHCAPALWSPQWATCPVSWPPGRGKGGIWPSARFSEYFMRGRGGRIKRGVDEEENEMEGDYREEKSTTLGL